ncbi:sigma-54-dependent transcriptional regulator [Pseudomonadota bacterium]
MSNILIIEDEVVIRSALKRLLQRNAYEISEAGSVDEAVDQFDLLSFALIIADLRLPGAPGTDIIGKATGVPVLIMTSFASISSAVESMKKGAIDYISKPFDHDELIIVVKRILKQGQLERQNAALRSDLQREYPVGGMVGSSQQMQEVSARIDKVASTNTTVLIVGESGTGKELVARAIHENSLRKDAPLIAVNCAAIPDTLIESELFGHERGAFTGAVEARTGLVEAADGGTLFLDEIAELSLSAQAQLLRVLQDGEVRRVGANTVHHVDVRLVAATHRDLQLRVSEGEFRSDLYFRLRVIEIMLPPLRERGEDLISLLEYMLDKVCKQLDRKGCVLTEEALDLVKRYRWPGNVRELENAVERAVILCEDNQITPDLLSIEGKTAELMAPVEDDSAKVNSLDSYFVNFVRENEGSLTETELAKRLGISRKTLWERRQRSGIPKSRILSE